MVVNGVCSNFLCMYNILITIPFLVCFIDS
jgi:hypothetical protein